MSKLDNLWGQFYALRAQKNVIEAQMKKIEDEIDLSEDDLAASVTEVKRKASSVLTNKLGLSIVVPHNKNTHNERNVHWHINGKKADVVHSGDLSRMCNYSLKIWLAEQTEMS